MDCSFSWRVGRGSEVTLSVANFPSFSDAIVGRYSSVSPFARKQADSDGRDWFWWATCSDDPQSGGRGIRSQKRGYDFGSGGPGHEGSSALCPRFSKERPIYSCDQCISYAACDEIVCQARAISVSCSDRSLESLSRWMVLQKPMAYLGRHSISGIVLPWICRNGVGVVTGPDLDCWQQDR